MTRPRSTPALPCTAPHGCTRPQTARRLCMTHYVFVRRHGGNFSPDAVLRLFTERNEGSEAFRRARDTVADLTPVLLARMEQAASTDERDRIAADLVFLSEFAAIAKRVFPGRNTEQVPGHGTVPRYNRYLDPCRCQVCRTTWTAYLRYRRLVARYSTPVVVAA